MFRRLTYFMLCFVGAVVFATIAHASDDDWSVEEVLEISGVLADIRYTPDFIESAANTASKTNSDKSIGRDIKAAMNWAFDVDEMIDECIARFQASGPEAYFPQVSQFLRSPLGKRISKLELETKDPANKETRLKVGGEILAKLPESDPERLEFYIWMTDELGLLEFAEAFALNVGYATISGMMASGKAPVTLTDEEIIGLLKSKSGEIRKQLKTQIYTSHAYAYQSLSMNDLETYGEFISSSAGRKFYQVWLTTVEDIMTRRMRASGARLMEMRGIRKS